MAFKKMYSGISRNVIILGVVSLFTDLSGQMVFPLLPLYITTVLGGSAVAVGLVEGAAEATASLLKVVSGYWSDKISKRKPFVFFGYSLSAVMKPVLAFAGSWPAILAIRVFDRIGKGLRDAPRDAIIAQSNSGKNMGKAYGFHRAMDGAGSVGGSILAFLLLPIFGFANIFRLAIIPGIFSVATIFFVKEPEVKSAEEKKPSLRVSYGQLTSELKTFILIASLFTLGNYNYAFLMLKAKAEGATNEQVILFYSLFYLIYTLLSTYAGSLSDKFGRRIVLIFGYGIFAGLSVVMAIFSSIFFTIAGFILFGVFFSLVDGVQRAFVADLAPANLKGTALGTFHTFIGLAALPAGYIAGTLWERAGSSMTFAFGAVIGALTIYFFIRLIKTPLKHG